MLPAAVIAITLFLPLAQAAVQQPLDQALVPFVPPGDTVLAVESADLNGDGTLDFVLVTETMASEGRRTLSIITRSQDRTLKLAARNDRVVFCRECGGIFGDPFLEVNATRKSFVVRHYGGSNARWTHDFTFGYSRRDRAWQLVKVEQTSFHVSDPSEEERHVYVPPRDFGKIDLVDFDPDAFLGKGER